MSPSVEDHFHKCRCHDKRLDEWIMQQDMKCSALNTWPGMRFRLCKMFQALPHARSSCVFRALEELQRTHLKDGITGSFKDAKLPQVILTRLVCRALTSSCMPACDPHAMGNQSCKRCLMFQCHGLDLLLKLRGRLHCWLQIMLLMALVCA